MLTRLIVVIIWRYIQVLNHYVVHLKLIILYVNYTSVKENEIDAWALPPRDSDLIGLWSNQVSGLLKTLDDVMPLCSQV